MVGQILSRPEYMGDTVNFRTSKVSYKDRSTIYHPKEEWLVFRNTHEAIVDRETWELAQKLRKTPRRVDTIGSANPLTGLVFCADCGAKMYNQRHKGGTQRTPYASDAFECSSYKLAYQKRMQVCRNHYITTKALRTLVLESIRTISTYAIANQEEFVEKVRAASVIKQVEAARGIKRRLNKDRRRIEELDTVIKKLYESFAVGRVSEERFDALIAEYEAEQKTLRDSVAETEAQLSVFDEDTAHVEQFLAVVKKYTDFSELTTPMLNEFVDKIIVHAPEKIDGARTQEVEIHFNFIGQFELPPKELTPEETKRQAQLHRHRIKSRERYQLIKAGEHTVSQPFTLTCQFCGKTFASRSSGTMYCDPKCRAKSYIRKEAEKRRRECVCGNCGVTFSTTRNDVKYCCNTCKVQANQERQKERNAAKAAARAEQTLQKAQRTKETKKEPA